jgi:ABC-type uncharacterized transport system YnjBCD ATPase subunit
LSKTEREDYIEIYGPIGSTGGLCAWIVRLWQVHTLLNIISGLLHPSQGRILFNDKDVTMAPTTRRNIAQVSSFQATR